MLGRFRQPLRLIKVIVCLGDIKSRLNMNVLWTDLWRICSARRGVRVRAREARVRGRGRGRPARGHALRPAPLRAAPLRDARLRAPAAPLRGGASIRSDAPVRRAPLAAAVPI